MPDPLKKETIQCIFCNKKVHSGIKRFKQHLSGHSGDAKICQHVPPIVSNEMAAYLKKNARTVIQDEPEDVEQNADEDGDQVEAAEPAVVKTPSSGTKVKQAKKKIAQSAITSFVVPAPPNPQTQKYSKGVTSMLYKTPEEVVSDRYKSKTSQSTIEHCTKKGTEAKQIVDDHVADFFYENGIPFNVINSRSWEILLESIGQYGHGYRSPTYHEIRGPLLERAEKRTMDLRKKHEESWKEYGCTIMSDGWTDTSRRHLINFLANSPAGTFFLGSVNASSEVADANMLADLLEKQIDKVGKEYVVQLVTDNGSNFKAAGRILMERIPHLFWTPCAAHCLNLLLEDIGAIKEINTCINSAKKVSRFIYKHGRLLDLMRDKLGGDLVRPGVTRFATSYLTLASMYRHKNGLRNLFVSDEWHNNNLAKSAEGKQAENIVLSMPFWSKVEMCLKASQPLLVALRLVDGDETPAAPEIMAAMDVAKNSIKDALKGKPALLTEVLNLYEKRWDNQMEQKLYGAALFLNPAKFFVIKENDKRQAARLRSMFNDVLWKMVSDDNDQTTISKQADDYERSEGECFSKQLAINDRTKKNPILWWGSYGGLAFELQTLAKRIISLCCSASGCERNWSAFAHIHTKKRNRLEHKRLNRLVSVSYNRKMHNRFQKIRELGSKGKKSNPLLLEEFEWENEWVDDNCEPVHTADGSAITWAHVDAAVGATHSLRGRNPPRAAAARAAISVSKTYTRKRKRPRAAGTQDIEEDESDDHDMRDESEDQQGGADSESEARMDEDESPGHATARDGGFHLDDDLLI
ncbi:hypothetical protein BS78_03G205900 [Paspalum vaginatum]|nr:hypothetical protein BS78_03G205900 [Paspalum vaginatum]